MVGMVGGCKHSVVSLPESAGVLDESEVRGTCAWMPFILYDAVDLPGSCPDRVLENGVDLSGPRMDMGASG